MLVIVVNPSRELNSLVLKGAIINYIIASANQGSGAFVTVKFKNVYEFISRLTYNPPGILSVRNMYVNVIRSLEECIVDWKAGKVVFNRDCLRNRFMYFDLS